MRELKVGVGWSKERERKEFERKGWSLEEDSKGEREEKKSLKENREEEIGVKERRVLMEDTREVMNGSGFWRWSSGLRSMSSSTRWVWL